MPVLPSTDAQLIAFCEAHAPVFISNAVAIGITAGQATAFDAATKASRLKLNAALAARNASKAATTDYHGSAANLRSLAADVIRFVKAFADANANPPAIYALAQIPEPTPPSPLPPPGQPTDFSATLNASGSVTLRWKCTDAAPSTGAFFTVRRQLGGMEGFSLLGTTQSKSFDDAAIPLGVTSVSYIIQSYRNDVAGPAGLQFNIQFGVGGQSLTILNIGTSAGEGGDSLKVAA